MLLCLRLQALVVPLLDSDHDGVITSSDVHSLQLRAEAMAAEGGGALPPPLLAPPAAEADADAGLDPVCMDLSALLARVMAGHDLARLRHDVTLALEARDELEIIRRGLHVHVRASMAFCVGGGVGWGGADVCARVCNELLSQ